MRLFLVVIFVTFHFSIHVDASVHSTYCVVWEEMIENDANCVCILF